MCKLDWVHLSVDRDGVSEVRNPHVKGHVVWFAIMVCVGDVMDCANSHRHLTDGVDDGQVDDSPEEGDSAERSLERKLVKVPANHK